jgi:hypothetical protein
MTIIINNYEHRSCYIITAYYRPPIEHMKLCLFKLESADYTGAIFDVTQCTAFLCECFRNT